MNRLPIIFSLFLWFCLTGCALFDSGTDKICDGYEVGWIDLHESRSINKGEELVPAYVFAVGHNSNFIYAKQHPLLPNTKERIDKKITNFFIIERTDNSFQDKPKYGPLTKSTFDSLCTKLNIVDLDFDQTYPTNLY